MNGRRCSSHSVPASTEVRSSAFAGIRCASTLASSRRGGTRADTRPLAADTWVRQVFRSALRAAGIRDFRWKDQRHTYATRLNARNGVGMKTIATLLGHTTTRMTERYTHATELLAAVQGVGRARNVEVVAPELAPKSHRTESAAIG